MSDICQILFFSGISNAFGIQGDAKISNVFKYYKRGLNICNAFETFKTRLKYSKRVLNISNTFETFKTPLNIINVF